MSGENWTPGPWIVDPLDGRLVTTASGEAVLQTFGRSGEALANGTLGAAGPELYEALEKCVHNWSALGGPAEDWLHEARAALRKARGEA